MAVPVPANVSDSGDLGGGTTLTHTIPSEWSVGDLVIACVNPAANRTVSTPAAGWTLLHGPITGQVRMYWYWKKLEAGDINASHSWVLNASGSGVQQIGFIRVTGHDPTTPINTSTSGTDGSTGTSHVSPEVTTTADDCLILRCIGTSNALTAVSGDTGTQLVQNLRFRVFHSSKSTAGATGTATYSTVGSVDCGYATIAIAPPDEGDEDPPTLSSPAGTATGHETADLSVSTDEGNGTLYAVVTTNSTGPSAAQVKAGQDHTGASAAFADSQAISSTGSKDFEATGLTPETEYWAHFMHEDAATNQSDVATSASFTTDAEPADPLAAGTASFVSSGPGEIHLSATDATGGTTPYTYQWERNEDGGSFADLTGETALTLTDTDVTPGVLYGHRLKYTDDVPDTVTSNTVTAQVYSGGPLTGGSSSIFQSSVIRGA